MSVQTIIITKYPEPNTSKSFMKEYLMTLAPRTSYIALDHIAKLAFQLYQ